MRARNCADGAKPAFKAAVDNRYVLHGRRNRRQSSVPARLVKDREIAVGLRLQPMHGSDETSIWPRSSTRLTVDQRPLATRFLRVRQAGYHLKLRRNASEDRIPPAFATIEREGDWLKIAHKDRPRRNECCIAEHVIGMTVGIHHILRTWLVCHAADGRRGDGAPFAGTAAGIDHRDPLSSPTIKPTLAIARPRICSQSSAQFRRCARTNWGRFP